MIILPIVVLFKVAQISHDNTVKSDPYMFYLFPSCLYSAVFILLQGQI